jgi:hypothetical protein
MIDLDMAHVVWWSSLTADRWPMVVVERDSRVDMTLLAHEVRAKEADAAWEKIRVFDTQAVRVIPNWHQYKRVIVESPFKGGGELYKRYLQRCLADCVSRGESPYASHRMLPGVLDDSVPAQRQLGMRLGFAWRKAAELTAVYSDYGVSSGMQEGVDDARVIGQALDYRKIGKEEEDL